jgi:hypothetical protein
MELLALRRWATDDDVVNQGIFQQEPKLHPTPNVKREKQSQVLITFNERTACI